MVTILCIDADPLTPQLLAAQLAQTNLKVSVVVASTVAAAIAQLQALAAGGLELPLVVAHQALTEAAWLEPLYRQFPQALTLSLGESAELAAVERLIPPGQLYRCLALPLDPIDLRLTLGEALRRYRHEQALAKLQAELEAAHQLMADFTDCTDSARPSAPVGLPDYWQTDLALRANVAQQQALLSALPDITSVLNAQGQYVDFSFNGFTGKLVPVACADLVGVNVTEAFPPEVARQWLEGIEQALATGEPQGFEQQLCFGDRIQYEEVRIVPYQDDLVLSLVRDISERKTAEIARQESEQQLQLTLAFTGIGTWRWYPATGEHQWTGPMGDLLEIDLAQPDIYQQWRDRIHPDDLEGVEASMQTALANRQPFADEYRYRLSDGSIGWRWVKGQGHYSETGDLEYVLGVVQDTTAPRQIEAALRESEQRRLLALDLTNTGSWEFDVVTSVVVWSDSHYRLMGLPPSSQPVSYHVWRDALHPDDRDRAEATFAQAMATATPLEMEYRVVWPDGTVHWVLSRGHGVYDDQGQPLKMLGVMVDIGDRKAAEIALKQSQDQLQMALNFGQIAIWSWDAAADQLRWNDIGYRLWGIDPSIEPLTHDHWLQAIHPEDRAIVEYELRQAKADRRAVTYEYRVVLPDGTHRWIADTGQTIYAPGGQLLGAAGVMYDITQRKTAQLALQESETRFRQLAETVREGFYVFDGQTGQYEYTNSAFNELVDLDALAENGMAYWLNHIHPDDRDRVDVAAQQLFRGISFEQEYRFQGRDDQFRWIRSQAFPVSNAVGDIVRIVGTVEDINERKRTEQALALAEERYRRATQAAKSAVWELNLKTGRGYLDPRFKALAGYTEADLANDSTESFVLLFPENADLDPARPTSANLAEVSLAFGLNETLALIHPEDRGFVTATFRSFLAEVIADPAARPDLVAEYRLCHQDNSEVWVLSRGQIQCDDQGQPTLIVGTTTDITDLKRAEQALQQLNHELEQRVQQRTQEIEKLAAIVENSTDFIGTASLNGEATYINRAGRQLLGLPLEGPIDQPVTNFHNPAAAATLTQEALPIAMQQGFWRGETTLQHQCTGETIAVEQIIFTVYEPNTQQPVCLATMCRDIRDRVRLDAERQQAELALKESEARFRSTFEQSALGIVEASLDGQMMQVNQKFCQMIGYPMAELRGKTYRDITHPDDIGDDDANVQRLLSGEVTSFEMEKRYLRADGSLLWVILAGSLVRDGLGQPQYLLGVVNDISDRKRAEQAFQESRNMLQLVLDTIPQRVFWKDRESRYLGCNSAFACDLAHTPDQIVGQTDADLGFVHAHRYHQEDAQIFSSQTPQINYEEPLSLPTDPNIWTRTSKVPLTNTNGEVIGVLGCYEDISDRKQAETALQESRQMLQLVLDTIPQRVFWKDRESRFLGCNATFSGDFQLTPEQIVGKTDADMPWAAYAEAYQADDAQVIATQTPKLGYEEPMSGGSDGERWILTSKIPLTNANGEVIGVLGCYEDISDRKQAEARLREQEQFLRSIYEGVSQPIFVSQVGADGSVRMDGLNPAGEALLGKSTAEIAGKTLAEVFAPAEAAELLQRHQFCITARQAVSFEENINFHGQPHWIISTYTPLLNQSGTVFRVVGTVFDITDRKLAEDALKTLNQELEQRVQDRTQALRQATELAEAASQAKSMFLANMSHELRTPLNAILGFSQLMAREADLGSANHRSLEIINRSGEHLLELINDILEMAKIEAGQLSLNPVDFDLDALLNAVADLFDVRARGKGLELIVNRHPALPSYLHSDEAKLRQVLINLISNAVKFTARGQICLRVAATQDWLNRPGVGSRLSISFTVTDTGIGIATADLNRLLEPFVQAHQGAGIHEGTGLGLAISRQFVRLLGGEITIESEPGLGSAFTFTIPMAVAEGKTVPAPEAPLAQVAELVPGQPTYRILVADDDSAHRHLLSQLLRSVGFEVDEAEDGQGAIALWESWHPHLIWLDMRMPMMTGCKVAHYIRAQEQAAALAPTKIIALTANAFADDRALALAQGCDDFVSKPFQLNHVLLKMAEHLGVDYVYRAASQRVATAPMDDTNAIAALGTLPQKLLAQLYDATLKLDSESLAEIIEQIALNNRPLAALLHQQLEIFAFDTIHTLLQQVSKGTGFLTGDG
ncbi:PAS domain S-box protein [Nodosilinea sp. E11]|uniref:PAS domain S-box protein n=1 Tax=Nodosilinea sp. E11 TaxID=3037479 RepID=UPI0029345DA7|nr:PAS domain S-box protein [Nodosilinea sp. E11]WOD36989.1 PAS domain S-box protein [Nodosilinea sp. E11]